MSYAVKRAVCATDPLSVQFRCSTCCLFLYLQFYIYFHSLFSLWTHYYYYFLSSVFNATFPDSFTNSISIFQSSSFVLAIRTMQSANDKFDVNPTFVQSTFLKILSNVRIKSDRVSDRVFLPYRFQYVFIVDLCVIFARIRLWVTIQLTQCIYLLITGKPKSFFLLLLMYRV